MTHGNRIESQILGKHNRPTNLKAGNKATALVDGYVLGSSIEVSDDELHVEPNGFVVGQDQDAVGGGFQGYQSLNGAIADMPEFP